MGIKELSLELAAVSLIADEAKKAKDRLRAALQTEMDKIGADRVKAEYGDDVIAYVTTSSLSLSGLSRTSANSSNG